MFLTDSCACRALGKDTAFVFQVGNKEPNPTEWERFLETVDAVLKP